MNDSLRCVMHCGDGGEPINVSWTHLDIRVRTQNVQHDDQARQALRKEMIVRLAPVLGHDQYLRDKLSKHPGQGEHSQEPTSHVVIMHPPSAMLLHRRKKPRAQSTEGVHHLTARGNSTGCVECGDAICPDCNNFSRVSHLPVSRK